jgi:hypothetical protein
MYLILVQVLNKFGYTHLYLTASFFETGAMATMNQLQNPTLFGLGAPSTWCLTLK